MNVSFRTPRKGVRNPLTDSDTGTTDWGGGEEWVLFPEKETQELVVKGISRCARNDRRTRVKARRQRARWHFALLREGLPSGTVAFLIAMYDCEQILRTKALS